MCLVPRLQRQEDTASAQLFTLSEAPVQHSSFPLRGPSELHLRYYRAAQLPNSTTLGSDWLDRFLLSKVPPNATPEAALLSPPQQEAEPSHARPDRPTAIPERTKPQAQRASHGDKLTTAGPRQSPAPSRPHRVLTLATLSSGCKHRTWQRVAKESQRKPSETRVWPGEDMQSANRHGPRAKAGPVTRWPQVHRGSCSLESAGKLCARP